MRREGAVAAFSLAGFLAALRTFAQLGCRVRAHRSAGDQGPARQTPALSCQGGSGNAGQPGNPIGGQLSKLALSLLTLAVSCRLCQLAENHERLGIRKAIELKYLRRLLWARKGGRIASPSGVIPSGAVARRKSTEIFVKKAFEVCRLLDYVRLPRKVDGELSR